MTIQQTPPQDVESTSRFLEPVVSTVEVTNFKRIDQARIDLGDITYLVGGNNSGKSSILQAIHTAYSCARLSFERGGKGKPAKVLPETELLYRPTEHFVNLGHNSPYQGKQKAAGEVRFNIVHTDDATDPSPLVISMYKAHNHNNAGVDIDGGDRFQSVISDTSRLFSVYVPGLTGVPLNEEYKSLGVILRTAAGGEANLVFRNILLHLDKLNKLGELQQLLASILGKEASFDINFEEERSQYIDVKLSLGEDDSIPVDLWGTGVLQVTQMLAYALLFRPHLFLIDEPDSHLHPSLQRTLADTFNAITSKLNCRIIISTHSRHMITAAPEGTRVAWMKDGEVVDPNAKEVSEVLVDLGALDDFDRHAQLVVYTEDTADSALKRCLDNMQDKPRVSVLSYDGVKNAPKVEQLNALVSTLNANAKIVIHRDRDCMTDEEIETWAKRYEDAGIRVFVPLMTDTESYYCTPSHIADALKIDKEEARTLIHQCREANLDRLRQKFFEKRAAANTLYHARDGGSPCSEDLWEEWVHDNSMRHVCGKELFSCIRKRLKTHQNRERLGKSPTPELSNELRSFLDNLSDE